MEALDLRQYFLGGFCIFFVRVPLSPLRDRPTILCRSGSNTPRDWQSLFWAREKPVSTPGQVRYHWATCPPNWGNMSSYIFQYGDGLTWYLSCCLNIIIMWMCIVLSNARLRYLLQKSHNIRIIAFNGTVARDFWPLVFNLHIWVRSNNNNFFWKLGSYFLWYTEKLTWMSHVRRPLIRHQCCLKRQLIRKQRCLRKHIFSTSALSGIVPELSRITRHQQQCLRKRWSESENPVSGVGADAEAVMKIAFKIRCRTSGVSLSAAPHTEVYNVNSNYE